MKAKKRINIILLTMLLTFYCNISIPVPVCADTNPPYVIIMSDKYEWRYKTVNGKLYKRLFNVSKKQWIGDWILVS